MAPLFSKVDINKLWHDVQNEETLICAKFGTNLFNISKDIGCKKVAQFFWLTVYNLAYRWLGATHPAPTRRTRSTAFRRVQDSDGTQTIVAN